MLTAITRGSLRRSSPKYFLGVSILARPNVSIGVQSARPAPVKLNFHRPFTSSASPLRPFPPPARKPLYRSKVMIGLFIGGSIVLFALTRKRKEVPVPKRDFGDHLFTRGDVRKHTSKETGIWVTSGDGVYDITEFVDIHPGGERILLAAGHSIDAFWAIFAIHQSEETRELLETYRIGNLMPADQDPTFNSERDDTTAITQALERLFHNDPVRDPQLITRSERPCNAETPPSLLTDSFVTPNNLFFVRNHLPVPEMDLSEYTLEIDAPWVKDPIILTLDDIKSKFPHIDVMTTLQCAGNRRREMHDVKPVKGLQWTQGAISNAVWTGVPLATLLKETIGSIPAEYEAKINHCQFHGAEGYGASIPVDKALDPKGDCILTFAMNGETLPKDHGWPLRALVPGHVAARSVKWVTKIALSEDESDAHWQQRDYKGFGPSKTLEQSDYATSQSIQELPVQSCVTVPQQNDSVEIVDGKVTGIKGYAWSGGGRGIIRVDVSIDGGKTWTDAVLTKPNQPPGREWAWTHWEAEVPVNVDRNKVPVEIVVKAVDTSYNEQPQSFDSTYNVRGVLVSAWHRVKAEAVKKNSEPAA
ncbi:Oxidoreductase, molybdopterin-binding domain-containing protein [Obelidium mucronatum]|nr:Oxidoreductase, molybdopterin-binding domain-containing protein [Obelidium mucronatum]